ncbi:2-oxo acid dehydrogenase subunit E2 [Gephyromycinifex aptenodytis]|uniref:2-oxo acid dehydrogenase subunit E2 n=1 Tax=Gephyromycinifex aptenodytis TaxID=2716227 RepID=UPI001446FDC3|nr:2-oxo acid dehydrogenase subunit E2 [Gephyromycinifex aptenodytis]
MGVKRFNLPDPGEGLTEAEIISWRVKPGDTVKVNQIVVEIETSKSLVELPIPWEGTVTELLVAEGTEVEIGTPIIAVEVAGAADDPISGDPNAGATPEAAVAGLMAGAADDGAEVPGSESRVVDSPGSAAGVQRFLLPDPGEGLTEATIIAWKVAPGDAVKVNQIVVEIETSKSLVELPIPWEGTVTELLVEEGVEVEIGTPIIAVAVAGAAAPAQAAEPDEPAAKREPNLVGYGEIAGSTSRRRRRAAPAPAASAEPAAPKTEPAPTPAPAPTAEPAPASPTAGRPLAKPPVRKFAKDNGIDLAQVPGTGKNGIITRADVEAFLSGAGESPAQNEQQPPVAAAPAAGAAAPRAGERETRIPIKGVRKMTAQAMSASAFTAPHVTEFITLDISATMELIERLKTDREFRDVKVTPLLVVAKAVLLACKRNPGINATWDEASQEIVQKNYVNLGIAAATPRGLIVPNIKDADAMNLRQLAEAMGSLVETARAGRTQPGDMSGGSITITNVGVFGVDTGTPIINPGEAAILCFGAVRRMPWVVTAADGTETIQPRWVTQLGLSFDHRLVDGDLGSRFIADVAAVLEDPAKGLIWG